MLPPRLAVLFLRLDGLLGDPAWFMLVEAGVGVFGEAAGVCPAAGLGGVALPAAYELAVPELGGSGGLPAMGGGGGTFEDTACTAPGWYAGKAALRDADGLVPPDVLDTQEFRRDSSSDSHFCPAIGDASGGGDGYPF